MCEITVLFPFEGRSATKTFEFKNGCWQKISDYDLGTFFRGVSHSVSSIDDIAEFLLSVEKQRDRLFVVRGQIKNPKKNVRRCKNDVNGLRDVSRSWLMLDIDKISVPAQYDICDLHDHPMIVDYIVSTYLPSEFQDVRMFYQFSSSTKLTKNLVGIHLWMWLDRPMPNAVLKSYVKNVLPREVDSSVLTSCQPHYITPPELIGAHDPMPSRCGWRDGADDFVALPAQTATQSSVGTGGGFSVALSGNWLVEVLAKIGDDQDGFHEPIRETIWLYVNSVAKGLVKRNDWALVEVLIPTILNAHRINRTYDEVKKQYANEDELRRQIRCAYEAINSNNKNKKMR